MNRKFRFHLTVVAGVLVIVGIMAISSVSMILTVARRSARDTAQHLFDAASLAAREQTVSLLQPALDFATVSAFVQGIETPVTSDGTTHPGRELFARILKTQPTFYSMYIGYADGTFFQVIHADENHLITSAHDAPDDTSIILRTITGLKDYRSQRWTYVDNSGKVIGTQIDETVEYDPRQRPWYTGSLDYSAAVLSNPYVFNSLQKPGITASHVLPNSAGVVGVDLTISNLSTFVSSVDISSNGGMALLSDNIEQIAGTQRVDSLITDAAAKSVTLEEFALRSAEIAGSNWLVDTVIWPITPNRNLAIVSAAPLKDFMAGAVEMRRKILINTALLLLITVPGIVLWSRRLSRALKELAIDAERVGRMVFDGKLQIKTNVYEFHQLGLGFEVMKETIAERTKALHETLEKLEMLVDMGIAMSSEFNLDRLSEMILSGAKKLSNADGGSLYLMNEERDQLEFQIVLNDTLEFEQGGTSGKPVSMGPVRLYDDEGNENHKNVVTHAVHTRQTVNIADAYDVGQYDFSGTRVFDRGNNYRSVSFLTVPLKPRGGGDVLGALQLINAQHPDTGDIIPFPDGYQRFVEALSSAAAVAVQNWRLLKRQKRLFDDLVRFVASAIDAKSPYTARHCARVPEIAKILARKAENCDAEPFKDFAFGSLEEEREFDVGAWLHDCGKVTTPEYVVDKATKLETIYNRIHEIRTRFEVLLRDACIERYESILAGRSREDADRVFSEKERQLHEDFAFVAECNVGSEYMEDEKLERLKRIASTNWLRHFDDQIGLSWVEDRRIEELEPEHRNAQLPTPEKLIADRLEQIVRRENWTQEKYDKFGFLFTVPEHLYNRGELYNLSVRSGTLTDEERFKIDEHVAQSIIMLEHLPFPEDLARVPEYAGTHHEAPDGSGYPRKLTGAELSIPAKIMAIADIFEALTSTDRPYKRDKKLSEVIEILHQMKQQNHIDSDLFDLLLSSNAYKECARLFMDPDQIDDVDINRFLT